MKLALYDATASATRTFINGVAARYVEWELAKQGVELVRPEDCDVLLVTAVSALFWKHVPSALRKLGIEPKRSKRTKPFVVLGGQAAMCPAAFDPYVDACCVGEGRVWLETMASSGLEAALELPNTWIPGDTHDVTPCTHFPWDAPPAMQSDGVVRVFASRGCRRKCLFCQVGWQGPYQENDGRKLVRQVNSLTGRGYKVAPVTNDFWRLSFADRLHGLEFGSVSFSAMKNADLRKLTRYTKCFRIGVEAPSSRLRKFVGKPIDTDLLFERSAQLLNLGANVRWFLISGLPGECDDDYLELMEVVRRARREVHKKSLLLSFTAFCSVPASPLCLAPITDEYAERFERFKTWFFRERYTRRIQLASGCQVKGRNAQSCGSMACTEDDLYRGWLERNPPNWRVNYHFRDSLRRAYNVYAGKTGLPLSTMNEG